MHMMFRMGGSMTSEQWRAIGDFLFRPQRLSIQDKTPESLKCAIMDDTRKVPYQFYCDFCDSKFESAVTPTRCPKCKSGPGNQAIELEHKGFVAKTFPFYAPEK